VGHFFAMKEYLPLGNIFFNVLRGEFGEIRIFSTTGTRPLLQKVILQCLLIDRIR
jgi:hypothetical protein